MRKVRMPQSLADRDSLLGVEHEQLPDKVQEVHVDHICLWYYFLWRIQLLTKTTRRSHSKTNLKTSRRTDILPTLLSRLGRWPVKFGSIFEEFGLMVYRLPRDILRHLSHNHLHHGQMLKVIVRLEKRHSSVELH